MVDKRLLREAQRKKRLFLGLVGLGLGSGVLAILQANYLAAIINGVFLGRQDLAGVWSWMAALLGIMAVRSLFVWMTEVAAKSLAVYCKTDIRQRLLAHLFALGPVHSSGEQTGELVNVLVEGVENLEPYFARYLPQLFTAVAVPLLILGVAFPLDVTSALILLVTAPLIPVFMLLIGQLAERMNRRQWETLSRLSAHFLDVLQGLTTLKIFGRSVEQVQVIARLSGEFRDVTLGVLKIAFLSALVLELIATISTAVVAVTVGLRLLYFQLTFEQGFFLLLLAPEFYLPLRQLGTHFHAGMSGAAAADKIFRLLALPIATTAGKGILKLSPDMPVNISFNNVHYAYQNGSRPALQGFNLAIAPGQRIALVGASGSGKSTVARLLLGFIVPDTGSILVNGRALTEICQADWLAQVAFVPQSPHLFYRSVADNIALGLEMASRQAVVAAAKAAGAHEFIERLPQGYDTVIGEGGQLLSGGECRRIAIARAFLQDAKFLILDEATVGLDPRQEAIVEAALDRLVVGRTVLVIAHRLTTVFQADCIVVLEHGQVAESGRHDILMAKQGLYFQLVTAFRGEV
ncbi:MAG TPA: thiol reductant ABC exporter subunit CydD [Negativicutes bacterium]